MAQIQARSFACPSCGAPVSVESAFTRTVVCEFCGHSAYVEDHGLDPAGKVAKLSQAPSIFSLGRTGAIQGARFKVLGRLRYDYEDGFWDEWFLHFEDGRAGWITEEEGECALFFKEQVTGPMDDLEGLRVGRNLTVNGRKVFLTEICEAEIAGGEGELHYRIRPGTAVEHLEGNAGGGTLVSIELWPREIEVHVGRPVEYSTIRMDPGDEAP